MQSQVMLTAAQIRAARALLDWSRHKLADESGVPHSTLADYEGGRTKSMLSANMRKIADTVEKHGVIFTPRGVAFKE